MKTAHRTRYLGVQNFLILERVAGSKEFLLSVLLQAGGQFIGERSLGTIAEGQQISLSLGWDQPRRSFVATSQTAGSAPVLTFIPFASPLAADAIAPLEFPMTKKFALNSSKNIRCLDISDDEKPRRAHNGVGRPQFMLAGCEWL